MKTTPEPPHDPNLPEREETVTGHTAETRVVPTSAPPPVLPPETVPPPPPDEDPARIGYGMLLGIVLLAAVAAAIAAIVLLSRDDDEPAQTQTAPTTTATTSAGAPASVAVPSLVGLSESEASAALGGAGLEVTSVEVPGEPPEGRVLAQSPAAGERVAEGATVRINVSDGEASAAPAPTTTPTTTAAAPPPAQVEVPELGDNLRPALQQVQQSGLRARIQYVPSGEPLGTVLAQTPAPGTSVPETAQVTLNVASGPGNPGQVTVPDTTGQSVNEALDTLHASGLRLLMLRREVADQEQGGTIVAQTPAPGTRAPENAQVLVYMGAYSG